MKPYSFKLIKGDLLPVDFRPSLLQEYHLRILMSSAETFNHRQISNIVTVIKFILIILKYLITMTEKQAKSHDVIVFI